MPDEYESLLDSKLKAISGVETQDQNRAMQGIQMPGQTAGLPQPRAATFEERNRKDLPIDVTTGAPTMVRFGVAMRDTVEDQMSYLSEIYGPGMARQADTGDWLIKVVGEDGKPKEVVVNEQGLTAKDAFSMLAYAPETIGAIAAMRGGRKLPFIGRSKGATGFLRDVAAEAVGQETGGAFKDIGVRLGQGTEAHIGEIAERRGGALPFDMIIGGGLGLVGKAASKTITPIGVSTAPIDVEAKEGAERLLDRFGVEIPKTIGEQTGSQVFKRIEATAAQLPGSSKYFSEIVQKKTEALRGVMGRILGVSPGTGEAVGEAAVSHIRSKLTPLQEAVERSRNQLLREGSEQAMNDLGTTAPGLQMKPERVGASVREKIVNLRDKFRADSRQKYEEMLAMEGGRDRIFETPGLADEANKLIKSLPPKTEIASEVAYDAYGNPIEKTIKGSAPSKEFVPENVVGKLRELAANPKEQRSLADLIAMRSEVDNDIAAGEAIPGRQTKYLSEVRKMLTGAIDDAIESSGNPELKRAFTEANKFYADNVGKFKNKYVARLFKEIDEGGGFVNDEDIVHNIGPTEYTTFKELLGANSPEFTNLKQSIADSIFNSSLATVSPDSTLIDGKKLIANISKFYKDKRTIAEDVLGVKTGKLQQLGEVLSAVDSKLDMDKLLAAKTAGEPFEATVRRLVGEQKKLDEIYRSKILKDIGEGRVGQDFNASDFVNRFYESSSRKEIESVMAQLADNPEAVERLRRKMIEKVLSQAQRTAKSSDPLSLAPGDPLLPPNANSLKNAIGDLDRRGSLQTILGRETFDDIVALTKVVRGSDVNEQAFKAAGGIAAGSQVSGMLKGGVLNYASDYVKQKLASIVLASPTLRKWVSNGVMTTPLEVGGVRLADTKQGALITALIASTPFLEAVQEEFGEGAAGDAFLTALRRSVNLFERQQAGAQKQPEMTPEQLLDKRIFEAGQPRPAQP